MCQKQLHSVQQVQSRPHPNPLSTMPEGLPSPFCYVNDKILPFVEIIGTEHICKTCADGEKFFSFKSSIELFYPFQVNFYKWYKIGVQFYSFAWGCPVFPTSFTEETLSLFSIEYFWISCQWVDCGFISGLLTLSHQGMCCLHGSTLLFGFQSIAWHFTAWCAIWKYNASSFVLHSQDGCGYSWSLFRGSLQLLGRVFYLCKKCHWNFDRDDIKSVDSFG